jgi:hypothetical protein
LKSFVHIAKREDSPKAIATFSALAIVSILKILIGTPPFELILTVTSPPASTSRALAIVSLVYQSS